MYYDLYVVLDIFSRFVVAFTVAASEDSLLAKELLEQAMGVHGIPDVVHADRGTSMTSKPVAQLLVDLGVTRSHSRPRVSNDNPYSESLFKTAKYTPTYPNYFTDIDHARAWAAHFVHWYNHRHHHSALEGHTPADVHHGTWREVHTHRVATMQHLYATHPERFTRPPSIRTPMAQVALNHPTTDERLQTG